MSLRICLCLVSLQVASSPGHSPVGVVYQLVLSLMQTAASLVPGSGKISWSGGVGGKVSSAPLQVQVVILVGSYAMPEVDPRGLTSGV